MSAKLVRAKLPTGAHVTVGESFAKSNDLEILTDRPATRHGKPIRVKYPTATVAADKTPPDRARSKRADREVAPPARSENEPNTMGAGAEPVPGQS